MMLDLKKNAFLITESQHRPMNQWQSCGIENMVATLSDDSLDLCFLFRWRQTPEIDHWSLDFPDMVDDLEGATVALLERGPKDLMASHNLRKTAVQHLNVQSSGQPQHKLSV